MLSEWLTPLYPTYPRTLKTYLGKDRPLEKPLQNGPPLDKIVLGDGMFLEALNQATE